MAQQRLAHEEAMRSAEEAFNTAANVQSSRVSAEARGGQMKANRFSAGMMGRISPEGERENEERWKKLREKQEQNEASLLKELENDKQKEEDKVSQYFANSNFRLQLIYRTFDLSLEWVC